MEKRVEKVKVKIGTAARNLHLVCPEFMSCQTRGKKPQKRKIWLEERNDPASLQPLFVSKFIGRVSGDCTTDEVDHLLGLQDLQILEF